MCHRHIHRRPRRTGQPSVAHVADDANDLAERLLVVFTPHALTDDQLIVQRITGRPEALRHFLVDDHDTWRAGRVTIREVATANDRNPQHVEVLWRDEGPTREAGEGEAARPGQCLRRPAGHDKGKLPHRFQRHTARDGRRHDARNSANPGGTLVCQLRDAGPRFEPGRRHRGAHRHDIVRVEARIDSTQGDRRADQQRGTDDKHQGERDFGHHKRRAHLRVSTPSSTGDPFHRGDQVNAR